MEKPLASIVVPIYNVEKFLHRCVDSLLAQTYHNIEIILVDDGSPDRCPEICDDYAKQDQRIRVVHKKNGGLSSARNSGLDICRGKYIYLVDSDDYVTATLVEDTIRAMEGQNADLVLFGARIMRGSEPCGDMVWNSNFTSDQLKEIGAYIRGWEVWKKAYRRELWDHLRFPDGTRTCEDVYIMADIMRRAKKVVSLPGIYYFWERAPHGSLVQTRKAYSYYEEWKAWKHHEETPGISEEHLQMSHIRCCIAALTALKRDKAASSLGDDERHMLRMYLRKQGCNPSHNSDTLLAYDMFRKECMIERILHPEREVSAKVMKKALKLYAVNQASSQLGENQVHDIFDLINRHSPELKWFYQLLRWAIITRKDRLVSIAGRLIGKSM